MHDAYDHSFVLSIYDAAAAPDRWQSILDEFADRVNAAGAILFGWVGAGETRRLIAPHYSSFYDPGALQMYLDKCFEHESADQDVFEAHSLQTDGIDLIDDSVLAPSVDALKQRKNVEILQKFGLLHRSAGLLNKDDTSTSRFSVQFDASRGPASAVERATMAHYLPHIAKALDLGRPAQQLANTHHSLLSAMDQLTIGVCVLDAHGRVVVSNSEFQRQQADYSQINLRPDGTLALSLAHDQARFETLKQDARNHGKFGARPRKEAVSAGVSTFLCIEVTPLHSASDLSDHPLDGYVVYSTDTSRAVQCDNAPLQQIYGLTDAEAALLDGIGRGLTNSEIAEHRARSVATINSQVKSILSKSNCHTRTEFVRLMMSFGANFLK
jgi:DNA-binding CsgD family transcriptional regulator